jgi:hypothetical protein
MGVIAPMSPKPPKLLNPLQTLRLHHLMEALFFCIGAPLDKYFLLMHTASSQREVLSTGAHESTSAEGI